MILIAESDQISVAPTANSSDTKTAWPRLAHFPRAGVPRSRDDELAFVSAAQATGITGFYLSGVDSPADVEKASMLLRVAEAQAGKADGSLVILAEIATAKAALAIESFNRAIPRLDALVFNGDLLAIDIGADAVSSIVQSVCLKIPLAAKASEAMAFRWLGATEPADRLETEWLMAKRNGFSGIVVSDGKQAGLLQLAEG